MSIESSNVMLGVVSLSMRLGKKYCEEYSHHNSPKKFTQRQLLTCLVLKAYTKTTYRGVVELLEVSEVLRDHIGLTKIPHFTALQKFAQRSSVLEVVDAMLLELVQQFARDEDEVSIDSTGMETTSASAHYKARSGKTKHKYVKLSLCVTGKSMLPSSVVVSWGPANDKKETPELLAKASNVSRPKRLFADAGYDAEWVHEFCRDDWQVESFIKPAVHRSDGGLGGHYRSQMTPETLKDNGYGRRWIVESFMSGLKRTTGSALAARTQHSLFVEAGLRVLAYALRR